MSFDNNVNAGILSQENMKDVIGVRFDAELKQWLAEAAERDCCSVPAIIRRCVSISRPMVDGGFRMPMMAPRKGRK